jgi:putative two-component system response regulator
MSELVLCVDDDEQIRGVIARLVQRAGHDCETVGSIEEARRRLVDRPVSIVLCDIGLPDQSGLEFVDEIARTRPDVATVMVTGHDDPGLADLALELGAYGYLTKPFAENELLIDLSNALRRRKLEAEHRMYEARLEEEVALRTAQLRRAYVETVARLGRAIEYHDTETGEHVERAGEHARTIALAMGIEHERAELLRLASPLHDIGKIGIRTAILRKTGALSADERLEMERHTTLGHDLLAGSGNELLDLAATIAWTHHERWDGTGYPRRLAGEEIPLEGRIVAVADVFDALTSDRPYRAALTDADAHAEIMSLSGRGFDPAVVAAFVETRS